MKLIIDISENVYTRLFDNGIQDNEIATDDICKIVRSLRLGTPLPNITGEQISDVFQVCAERQTESLISRYQNDLMNTGHCKGCKYFEYDYVANINGMPSEDGYCFLYEPRESEVEK